MEAWTSVLVNDENHSDTVRSFYHCHGSYLKLRQSRHDATKIYTTVLLIFDPMQFIYPIMILIVLFIFRYTISLTDVYARTNGLDRWSKTSTALAINLYTYIITMFIILFLFFSSIEVNSVILNLLAE